MKDYTEIQDPYNSFIDRSVGNEVFDNPDQPLRDGDSFEDVWIRNFIRSNNWKPRKSGFTINGLTGYAEFSDVFVSGEVEASSGSIGGFDIGEDYLRDVANSFGLSSTVTGGDDVRFWAGDTFANRATAPFRITETGVLTIKKPASSQQITISGADGTLRFNDETGSEVINIGTTATRTIHITGNATSTGGVFFSATTAGNGYYYSSSSNIAGNAFRADILGATATTVGVFIDHDGSAGFGADINTSAGATGIRVQNTSTGDNIELTSSSGKALDIQMTGGTSGAIVIDLGSTSQNGLNITGSSTTTQVVFENTHTTGAETLKIVNHSSSTGTGAILIDKNNSGYAIFIDQDANSAASCAGIYIDINNAGAGLEYAFEFAGQESVNSAVGGTQDYKVRVKIGGTTYFIPCYTA